ncbi:MAG: hypothetical protein ACR2KW_09845 [Rubrobacter sp.]
MEYPQGDQASELSRRRFSYGEIVRSAFRISWRNKFLWFFGFFVGSGLSSSFNVPSNFGGGGQQTQELPNLDQFFSTLSHAASGLAGSGPVNAIALQTGLSGGTITLIIGAVLLAVVLLLLYIALVVVSQGGLAASVAAIDGGEERRFGSTWRSGVQNFWRVLLQAILVFLIALGLGLAIFVVVGLPVLLTFLLSESVGARIAVSVIFGLIGVLLFIAVFVAFAIVSQFAVRELVVGRSGVVASVGGAFRLFRREMGKSLLVWLLNIGLKILAGIATLIAFVLLALVLIGPGVAVALSGSQTTGIALGIIGGVLFLIPAVIITAAVGTYFHTYWTLAYLRMNGAGGTAVPVTYAPNSPSGSAYASPYPSNDPRQSATTATVERSTSEPAEKEEETRTGKRPDEEDEVPGPSGSRNE